MEGLTGQYLGMSTRPGPPGPPSRENAMRLRATTYPTVIVAAVAQAVLAIGVPAGALAADVQRSGIDQVLSHGGGQVLACRARSASGFISTSWAIRNTRKSDVVKATVKQRSIDFSGNWSEWQDPVSRSGWVNPGVTRSISKTSSSDAQWSNHQTKVTLTSRASSKSRTRTFTWTELSRC